jgi:hypothetical protein
MPEVDPNMFGPYIGSPKWRLVGIAVGPAMEDRSSIGLRCGQLSLLRAAEHDAL